MDHICRKEAEFARMSEKLQTLTKALDELKKEVRAQQDALVENAMSEQLISQTLESADKAIARVTKTTEELIKREIEFAKRDKVNEIFEDVNIRLKELEDRGKAFKVVRRTLYVVLSITVTVIIFMSRCAELIDRIKDWFKSS